MKDDKIKLRDLRVKEKYHIDDSYLNGYAGKCGWKATIVYNSLCRHSNKDQFSFPSVDLMAEQHNVSRDTIIDGIKILKVWNIIQVAKIRTESGTFKNNGYTLLDKSQWDSIQVAHNDLEPRRSQRLDQVAVVDSKDTHKRKDTHIKKYIKKENFSSLEDLTPEVVNEIARQYNLAPKFVNLQRITLVNYCESKGKVYKNYKAALKNFVLKSAEQKMERGSLDSIKSKPKPPKEKDYTVSTEERVKVRKRFEDRKKSHGLQKTF